MRAHYRLASFVLCSAIIAACGTEGSPASSTTSTTTGPSTTSTTIGAPVEPTTEPLIEMTRLAKADLVSRIAVDEADIEVLKAEEITWSDGSLGCPQPGMSYTQALVDGYQVVLFADGRAYDYHAGADANPFLCASGELDGGRDFVPPPGHDK